MPYAYCLASCSAGWDYPVAQLIVIGYCCNCFDGQLNCQAFAHWIISVTIMYWLCYHWLGPSTQLSFPLSRLNLNLKNFRWDSGLQYMGGYSSLSEPKLLRMFLKILFSMFISQALFTCYLPLMSEAECRLICYEKWLISCSLVVILLNLDPIGINCTTMQPS